jgi:predicted XRE-type DNA-binding protein
VKRYFTEIPEYRIAPTSMTASALVDALVKSKRTFIQPDLGAVEYNSMAIFADELGAFMHKYDDEMVGVLSAFYDTDVYAQHRRGNEIRILIKSPQVNMLAGTTPSNLLKFMPENAWEQGFTSRIIMIFSDERIVGNDFADHDTSLDQDLVHDLQMINNLHGQFEVTEAYKDAVNKWRASGEPIQPTHPKLIHYTTRRRVHLYKLSMIAAIDRSNTLLLTEEDFLTALSWLLEAEINMPDIFKAGAGGADAKTMDEIYHYILTSNKRDAKGESLGVSESRINNFARERLPLLSILRVIEVMERSGKIRALRVDRATGQRHWIAMVPDDD